MLKLALGILALFFISLFESGLNTAVFITFALSYSLASFMVPFKVMSIKKEGTIKLELIDFFGIAIIFSGVGLGLYYWGVSISLLLLLSPFVSGSVVLLITFLSLKLGTVSYTHLTLPTKRIV